ncbi:MAG: cobalt-precorrin-5B (C(1))-methyltransferase, partial [Syntrophaceae bacterium]
MGYTTGACAAAAAKAALLSLSGKEVQPERVEIPFHNGERHSMDIAFVRRKEAGVEAAVVKDAGDDPDITDGALVVAFVDWGKGEEIVFLAGEGVGTV